MRLMTFIGAPLLYLSTCGALLLLAHRFVRPITRFVAVVLVLIPLCFTGRAMVTGGAYGPFDFAYLTAPLNWMRGAKGLPAEMHNSTLSDVACQMIPWRAAVQDALQRHEWPLWNRYLFGGGVLAGSAQPAPYSPFTLIACLLSIGIGSTYLASIWLFVAALSAWLLAREVGCRDAVALVAAVAWPFCTAICYFILWPLGESWTVLPLVLLGVRRVTAQPRLSSAVLLMVAFTVLILAGHPETVLHVALCGALYGAHLVVRDRKNAPRAMAWATAAGVVALLLTAIFLLPLNEALKQSREYHDRITFFANWKTGTTGLEALTHLAVDFLTWPHFRHWAFVQSPPLGTAAAGSVIVALAIYAIWRVRSSDSLFFTGLLLLGLISGTNWVPVASLWKRLPLFDVSFNEYLQYAAAFSFVMLAALALEDVARRNAWRELAINVFAVTVVITAVTVILLRGKIVGPEMGMWGEFAVFTEIAAPAIATLILLARIPVRFVLGALFVLIAAQRATEFGGVYPVVAADAVYPHVPIFDHVRGVKEPFRVVGQGLALIPGMSTLYHLEDPRGYTAMSFSPYVDTFPLWCVPQSVWFNRVDDLEKPFLSFLNVRYAVTWTQEPEHAGWREVARQKGTKLLENTRVLERAFIPIEVGLGDRDPFSEMKSATDFGQRAWIRTPGPPVDSVNGAGRLEIHPRKLGFRIDATMEKKGWIVISEQRWTGWRAYIDGRRVQMFPANIAFLGLWVPQGQHRIDVRYWPESFVIGRAISGFTLVFLICLLGWTRIGHQ